LPANLSSPYTVCRLHARTSYALSMEADNGFGRSPPARQVFFTDETVPSGAPAHIQVHGHAKWKVDHLSVTRPEQTSYKFELNGLEPSTKYHFRLSASSTKGEGQRSPEHVVMTDVPGHESAPFFTTGGHLSFDTVRRALLPDHLLLERSLSRHKNAHQEKGKVRLPRGAQPSCLR
ncbi:fibronectin type III domain protein, partial [Teladorsagia circumcincta]